jgi:hypothetical protein
MKALKGKNLFTKQEINQLKELIKKRVISSRSEQKRLRDTMRSIGFYGRDNWGIVNLQLHHLDSLINSGSIKVIS